MTKPTEYDSVNHPKHYTDHPSGVECIQITEHMGFNLGNAIKYVWRSDLKGSSLEDLRKAIWYIDREIQKREATVEPAPARAEFTGGTHTSANTRWGAGVLRADSQNSTPGHGVTSPKNDVLDFPSGWWSVEWEYDAPLVKREWDSGEIVSDGILREAANRQTPTGEPVKLSTVIQGPKRLQFRFTSSQSVPLVSRIRVARVSESNK